jgi:hypothetical protein
MRVVVITEHGGPQIAKRLGAEVLGTGVRVREFPITLEKVLLSLPQPPKLRDPIG